MKLRIQGNSIRLRLNRIDMDDFAHQGKVSASVRFGGASMLTYTLERAGAAAAVRTSFTGSELRVQVPEAIAQAWSVADQVGFNASQDLGNGESLEIVVEKDFQCLHKGDEARDPDAYPNPLSAA